MVVSLAQPLPRAGELAADEVVVYVADSLIDGNIVVGNAGTAPTALNDLFIAVDDDGNNFADGGDGADSYLLFASTDGPISIAGFSGAGGHGDRIVVSASGFGGDLTPGGLDPSQFVSDADATAVDADDRFIYDTASGELTFDSDGWGDDPGVVIATLTGDALTHEDIVVIV